MGFGGAADGAGMISRVLSLFNLFINPRAGAGSFPERVDGVLSVFPDGVVDGVHSSSRSSSEIIGSFVVQALVNDEDASAFLERVSCWVFFSIDVG